MRCILLFHAIFGGGACFWMQPIPRQQPIIQNIPAADDRVAEVGIPPPGNATPGGLSATDLSFVKEPRRAQSLRYSIQMVSYCVYELFEVHIFVETSLIGGSHWHLCVAVRVRIR